MSLRGDDMEWKTLKDHIEIGVVYGTLFPEANRDERIVLDTLDLFAHDLFFERIELRDIKDPKLRAEIKRRIETTRMKVTYAAQPKIFDMNLNISSINEPTRQKAIEELKVCLDDAADFGADRMTMIAGPMITKNYEEGKQCLANSIVELSDYAEELGLKLHLEIHDYDIDKKRFLGPTKEAVDVLNKLSKNCPAFSYLIDLSHFPLLRESIEEAVLPLKNDFGYVHIGSSVMDEADERFGDMHPYFGYPAGTNDVQEVVEFFNILVDVGYLAPNKKVPITIEHTIWQGDRVEDLIVNMKRTMDMVWKEFLISQANKVAF